MDITNTSFFVFLATVYYLYYFAFPKYQWVCLLFSSLFFFFAASVPYTFAYVFFTTGSVYLATRLLHKKVQDRVKRIITISTIVINTAILGVLRYSNLFIHTINILFSRFMGFKSIDSVHFLAPLAISFYSLQMVAYLLDVYWGKIEPTNNPFKLLLFCIYFPQMISGPISRYEELSNDLFCYHPFNYTCFTNGLIRIAWGLVKKLAISNRIAIIVDYIWNNQSVFDGQWIWLSSFFYIFQIYTDFSGCMDIVLGMSEGFGILLPENFRAPFFSRSIQEFWRRWHITLGTWLKDYIMIPIQRSKGMTKLGKITVKFFGKKWGRKIPMYLSMLFLWFAMGLWHGNSWKYILGEGLWFWFVIVLSNIFDEVNKSSKKVVKLDEANKCVIAFKVFRTLIVYSFGMLFFRASSLSNAFERIRAGIFFQIIPSRVISLASFAYQQIGIVGGCILSVCFLAMTLVDRKIYAGQNVLSLVRSKHVIVRWLLYLVIVLVICLSMNVTKKSFAYAQF